MESIYREIILDHYQKPRNYGKLKDATGQVTLANPLCGDKITLFMKMAEDRVTAISFVGKGCAISIASASLLSEFTKNKTENELRKLDKNFIIRLLKVHLGTNRIKCALLPLEALHKLIDRF